MLIIITTRQVHDVDRGRGAQADLAGPERR